MVPQPGQRDPDVPIEELLARGTGSRVVVNPRSLDAGTIPFGGRVIDGEEQVVAGNAKDERLEGNPQETRGHGLRAATDSPKDIVAAAEVPGDPSRTEPRGDGA